MDLRRRPTRPAGESPTTPTRAISRRTALAVVAGGTVGSLAGCLGFGESDAADLSERWSSEQTTEYGQNHHDFIVTNSAETPRVVAPHSSHGGDDDCGIEAVDGSGEHAWRGTIDPDHCTPHAVGDIGTGTRDGTAAAFAGTEAGELLGFDLESGTELFRLDILDSLGYSAPIVGEFTGTGDELIVADFGGSVYVVDTEPAVSWSHELDSRVNTNPLVGESPAGEAALIIAHGRREESVVSALGVDHERHWDYSLDGTPNSMVETDIDGQTKRCVGTTTGVSCLDASGDGQWDESFEETTAVGGVTDGLVVVGTNDGTISALDADDGTVEWTESIVSGDERRLSAPAIGDGFGDGTPTIAAAAYDGSVVVLDAEGTILGRHTHTEALYVSPRFGDLTGDGSDDLLVMDGHGRLVAYEISDNR